MILLDPTSLQVLDKVGFLVHFDYFSKKAWFFGIIDLNLQKDLSKKEDLKIFAM